MDKVFDWRRCRWLNMRLVDSEDDLLRPGEWGEMIVLYDCNYKGSRRPVYDRACDQDFCKNPRRTCVS